jgi:hypothetical protein
MKSARMRPGTVGTTLEQIGVIIDVVLVGVKRQWKSLAEGLLGWRRGRPARVCVGGRGAGEPERGV